MISGLLLVTACGGSKSPPPAAPAPAPAPATAAAPDPAPAPAPAPEPAPAPDRKQDVLALLDKIDQQLQEAEQKKMKHVTANAQSIVDLVDQLADPVGGFPNASASYTKLKTQAAKFASAAKKEHQKDQHEHHHALVDITKSMRSQL